MDTITHMPMSREMERENLPKSSLDILLNFNVSHYDKT